MNVDSTFIEFLEQLEANLTDNLSALKIAVNRLKESTPEITENSAPAEAGEANTLNYEGVEALLECYGLPRDRAFIADVIKSCKRAGMDYTGLNELLLRVVKINSKNSLRDIKKYIFGSINNYKKA